MFYYIFLSHIYVTYVVVTNKNIFFKRNEKLRKEKKYIKMEKIVVKK